MNIIFCGTPDFSVPSLKKLVALAPEHTVVAVVSQPDRPKGRSNTPTPPPVAAAAFELGFPKERVYQPKSINRPRILDELRALQPDLLVVIAYGCILKREALALAKLMPINAHASLLPRFRGASPIQSVILAGDELTGVSVMRMEEGLDTGPVLFSREIPVGRDDAGALHDRLAELSADCLVDAVRMLAAGECKLTPQDDARATVTRKIEKEDGIPDFTRAAIEVDRQIRAMTPWPGVWLRLVNANNSQTARVRAVRAHVANENSFAPGTLPGFAQYHPQNGGRILIHCGSGVLELQSIQPEGKRAMTPAEYFNGAGRPYLIPAGTATAIQLPAKDCVVVRA